MFFFVQLVSLLQDEQRKNLYDMLIMHGMKPHAYWLATWIHFFVLTFTTGAVFVLLCRGAGVIEMARVPLGLHLLLVATWAHAQIAIISFLVFLRRYRPFKGRDVTVVAYVFVLLVRLLLFVCSLSFSLSLSLPPSAVSRLFADVHWGACSLPSSPPMVHCVDVRAPSRLLASPAADHERIP